MSERVGSNVFWSDFDAVVRPPALRRDWSWLACVILGALAVVVAVGVFLE